MAKGIFTHILAFAAGIGAGIYGYKYLVKSKMNERIKKETDEIRKAFKKRMDIYIKKTGSEKIPEGEKSENVDPSSIKYDEIIKKNDYTRYYPDEEKEEPVKERKKGIRIISPNEFGEEPDYAKVTLTYYSDEILVNEIDEILSPKEIEEKVGLDAVKHFGEYESDAVHIKNDNIKCYYEILLDQRTYAEMIDTKPYLKKE